jgi:undecaprenyl pyrophosphate phosphatase UppP
MKKIALIASALFLPIVSFAQQGNLDNLTGLATSIGGIIEILIPIIFALAVLGFFYGLVKYIFGAEHDKEQAKKTMIWGVVALFVMASVWGLVNWLQGNLGVDAGTTPNVRDLIPDLTP